MTHSAPETPQQPVYPPAEQAPAYAPAPAQPQQPTGADVEMAKTLAQGANSQAMPGLARIAGSSVARAVGWAAKGGISSVTETVKQVASGEVGITEVLDQSVERARHTAASALGIEDENHVRRRSGGSSYRDLKKRGNALIDISYNPAAQPRNEHPAFAQILDEITPDEARILRFLAVSGPQPSIDVRTKAPFGIGSERLAGGINMIADMAGCTWPDRSQQYLANLNRLGLVRFSEEPVDDPRRYALVECQPLAMEALFGRGVKAISIYRSIYLSLFGKQFAEVCFTLEGYNAGGWAEDPRGDRVWISKRRRKKMEAAKHAHH